MSENVSVFWFRRDLRLDDNAALYHALKSGDKVVPIFIFDKQILDKLEDKKDARVSFIHQTLSKLNSELMAFGTTLYTYYDEPIDVWKELVKSYPIKAVYANHDYEPYAIKRDLQVQGFLAEKGVAFYTSKDQVVFEKNEIVKNDGSPYTVFTPYSKKWKAKLNDFYLKPYPTLAYKHSFFQAEKKEVIALNQMGFEPTEMLLPQKEITKEIIINYGEKRNFPAERGTSRLGTHLRFGLISVRTLAAYVKGLSESYLNELIWREFYQMILFHFPNVVGNAFKPKYDRIIWRQDEESFQKWCQGKTGYPIVDAGMRELNATGYMHNRVRMVVASFLTKHLLIDWRWGEAYFAQKLLDFELASNNGGWQWASGSGCDAAPYFRIFNPYTQTEKFDKKLEYIKKWVPEFQELTYPKPIVVHKLARERVLEVYKEALSAE